MRKPDGFDNVEAIGNSEYKRLPAGGYVARITKVTDTPEKNFLHIEFDICEGEYTGYVASCLERNGFTPLNTRVYYDTNTPTHDPSYEKKHKTTMGIFKGFTEAVEQSNPPYVWEWKDQTLVGRVVGVVLGEREYRKQNGDIGTAWDVRFKTAAAIREGKFKVPEKKTLPVENTAPAFTPLADDDGELPF
jgi:hypothetical protein